MSGPNTVSGWARRYFFQAAAATGAALVLAPAGSAAPLPSGTADAIAAQPTPLPNGDQDTSDILIETLIDWGATHVFGIVGDGINPIIEALRKRRDRIRFVPVRHEEAAAFMASGFANTPAGSASASAPPVPAPSI